MKNNMIASLALFALSQIVASCSKNYNSAAPATKTITYDHSGLNALFSDLRTTPQSFTVQAGTSVSITGTNGTVMQFYPNTFKDASGHVITSGTVSVQLTEMYKPGDMIANRASTMAQGNILKSGGQINITAAVNGQTVFANNYGVKFMQQTASTAPMNLFYGSTSNIDSVATWTNGGDSTHNGTIAWGTTSYGADELYVFDSCSHFGYINCDALLATDSPKTAVTIIVPDSTYNPSNTQLYLVIPTLNSVISNVESYDASTNYIAKTNTMNIISEGHLDIVPTGMNYKFVVITKKNGNYYYYETSGITTMNMKLTATMQQKTSAQVKTLLSAL